jgi:hypothetical protein
METIKDYRELLALFNAHEVDYLIVGAYALAYYGAPGIPATLMSICGLTGRMLFVFFGRLMPSASAGLP